MGDTPKKPAFDPNAAYEVADDTAVQEKPAFDPNAKFDILDESGPPVSRQRPPLISHAPTSSIANFPGYDVPAPEPSNPHVVGDPQGTLQDLMKSPAFKQAAEKLIPTYGKFQPKTGTFQLHQPTAENILTDAQTNEPLLRHLIERTKLINPKLAGDADAALYQLDSRNRHGVSDLKDQNIAGLKSRQLNYNAETGELQKPLDFLPSVVAGIENNHKTIQAADDLVNTNPEDVVAQMEQQRKSFNPDVPSEAPSGMGGIIGSNLQPILKGILGSTAVAAVASDPLTAAAAPWVGALVSSSDFYKVALKSSFDNNYNEIRDKHPDIAPMEVYKEALKRAQFDANLAFAQGVAMTGAGLKIKEAPPVIKKLSGTAKQLFGQILENSGGAVVHALPELATTTGTAGAFQAISNMYSGKPVTQGVADAMKGNVALLGGITLISAGAHLLNPKPYHALINEFAKAPDHVVNETLAQAVLHGNLTPDQANEGYAKIQEQKDLRKGMPDDVPAENVQKIRNRLDKIDEIKNSMSTDNPEALHSSFHSDEKEKIKSIEAEIDELKQPVKEENTEPLFKTEKSTENAIPIKSYKGKSDADIENRMTELDKTGNLSDEYDMLEKEMEKRERSSVFDVPLEKVNDAVNVLMKKEKDQPNGYGSFIEKRDAAETKNIANKYLNASEISDNELKNDFKTAIMGNPDTWYADGLKLRESLKEASKRGIATSDMVATVEREFIKDHYSSEEAKAVIARKLKPIFENYKTSENAIRIGSPEKVHVDEAPGNSPEVGARVSGTGTEESANAQSESTAGSEKTPSKGIIKKANDLDVTSPRDQVLQHFTGGGKIHADVLGEMYKKETTDFRDQKASQEEMKSRIGLLNKKGARSLDELAHNLWETHGGIDNPHDTQDYKNAIMDVLGEHKSPGSMARELVDTYVDKLNNRTDISSAEDIHFDPSEIESWKGLPNNEKEAALSMDDKTADRINSMDITPDNIDEFNHLLNEDAYASEFHHPEEEAAQQSKSIPETEASGSEDKTASERAGKIKEAAIESMRVEKVENIGDKAAEHLTEKQGKEVIKEHARIVKNSKQLEQLIKCLW